MEISHGQPQERVSEVTEGAVDGLESSPTLRRTVIEANQAGKVKGEKERRSITVRY